MRASNSGRQNGLPGLPVLFIHGTEDDFIPPQSSERLYELKQGPKRLWLCPGAAHARSMAKEPDTYRMVLNSFLDENGL